RTLTPHPVDVEGAQLRSMAPSPMLPAMRAMGTKSWKSGQKLEWLELPTPKPGPRDVRVAVHAIGVNPGDWKIRRQGPRGLAARAVRPFRGARGPIILGVDFAGVVEEVGAKVKGLTAGTRVVGGTNFARGQHGSYADTVVVRASQVTPVPDSIDLET